MIHGSFRPLAGWLVPSVRAWLLLPGISDMWSPIDFVLDTGCTHTLLHPDDARHQVGISAARLRQPALWPQVAGGHGVGGSTTLFPVEARYRFTDDSGRIEEIAGQIQVVQLTDANEQLPSLLGWDVLQEFDISLNQRGGTVALRRL